MLACFTPLKLLLGFLLPAGLLLRNGGGEGDAQFGERFLMLARNSLTLSGLTALLAVACAARRCCSPTAPGSRWTPRPGPQPPGRARAAAVPGTVIAVGVLIPVTRLRTTGSPANGKRLRQQPGPAPHGRHRSR